AEGMQLEPPWTQEETLNDVQRTLVPGECRIRLVITRGIGQLSAGTETCTDPTPIIIVVALIGPPERVYREGVDVVISSVRRSGRFADIKSGSLIHQVLALREAKSKGAFEAILLTDGGKLSDGITSNIYLVGDGTLLTPSHDASIVEAITRRPGLEMADDMA